MNIVALLFSLVFIAATNGRCRLPGLEEHRPHILECLCAPNEHIDVNYQTAVPNITTLIVSSCASATVSADLGPNFENVITSITVENIEKVHFSPQLYATHFRTIVFSNIGYIESIKAPFQSIEKLDHFRVENTEIKLFRPNFDHVAMEKFTLTNVTIHDLQHLELDSNKSRPSLRIVNCHIRVTKSPLVFHFFKHITIIDSTFQFSEHAGKVSMFGSKIHLSNNVFFNATIDIRGHSINVTNTCADGMSSMRLQSDISDGITTYGNKLPTEIASPQKLKNNIVCKGAKCNCPTNRGCRGSHCRSILNHATSEASQKFFLHFIHILAAILARI